jgi:hypothetical protein
MKKSRFTEEQIVAILKEADAGIAAAERAANMASRRTPPISGAVSMVA